MHTFLKGWQALTVARAELTSHLYRLQDFGFRGRMSEHLLDGDMLSPVLGGAQCEVSVSGLGHGLAFSGVTHR